MALDEQAQKNARKALEAEKTLIEEELGDLGVSPEGVVEVSFDEGFADAAQTTSERSNVLSIAEGLQERLRDIRAALKKIDNKSYGTCDRCQREIDPERLEAIPTAILCITCKQETRS